MDSSTHLHSPISFLHLLFRSHKHKCRGISTSKAALALIHWGIPSNCHSRQVCRYDSHFITIRKLGSCFTSTAHFHPPVTRSLDRTGRTPCRPQCNGRPLFVRYWEAAAPGTNPNLLLRTESQHTSVDSDHSSAQYGLN